MQDNGETCNIIKVEDANNSTTFKEENLSEESYFIPTQTEAEHQTPKSSLKNVKMGSGAILIKNN